MLLLYSCLIVLQCTTVASQTHPAPVVTTNYTSAPNGPFPLGTPFKWLCKPPSSLLGNLPWLGCNFTIFQSGKSAFSSVDQTTNECTINLIPATAYFSTVGNYSCSIFEITPQGYVGRTLTPSTIFTFAMFYTIPEVPIPTILPNNTVKVGSNFTLECFMPHNSSNPDGHHLTASAFWPSTYGPGISFVTTFSLRTLRGVEYHHLPIVTSTGLPVQASYLIEGFWGYKTCNPAGCVKGYTEMFVQYDGQWSSWTYDSCRGMDVRTCTNPAPRHGGDNCPGVCYNKTITRTRTCHWRNGSLVTNLTTPTTTLPSSQTLQRTVITRTRLQCAIACTQDVNCLHFTFTAPGICLHTLRHV